jgi:hypothetical protein
VIALQFAFETKLLREICESEKKAKQTLGVLVAHELKERLADLDAAASVMDLPIPPQFVAGACVIDLADSYRLVACANHANNPTLKSMAINWSKVRRIKFLRIESDHA